MRAVRQTLCRERGFRRCAVRGCALSGWPMAQQVGKEGAYGVAFRRCGRHVVVDGGLLWRRCSRNIIQHHQLGRGLHVLCDRLGRGLLRWCLGGRLRRLRNWFEHSSRRCLPRRFLLFRFPPAKLYTQDKLSRFVFSAAAFMCIHVRKRILGTHLRYDSPVPTVPISTRMPIAFSQAKGCGGGGVAGDIACLLERHDTAVFSRR